MGGTFSSFNSALTGLKYSQVAADVASNNIANASTKGYVRRSVVATEGTSSNHAAIWSVSDGTTSFGVTVNGIQRNADDILTARSRSEHAKDGYLSTTADILSRVEDGINEPSENGLSSVLSDLRSSWASRAANSSAGNTVIANAQQVASTFASQVSALQSEATSDRGSIVANVATVNSVATSLANLNNSIIAAYNTKVDTADLLDQRDQMLKQLAEVSGATSTINTDGTATVSVGGATLVSGIKAGTLTVATGITSTGASDGSPVTFTVQDTSGSHAATLGGSGGGQIGAYTDALNTTIPGYLSQLNSVAKSLADSVNTALTGGYDSSGTAGTALFSYTSGNEAASLQLTFTDPSKLGVSSIAGTTDTAVATTLASNATAENTYAGVVNGFAASISSAKTLATNQSSLTSAVDDSLASATGVDASEELVNLTVAQHQYAASARVISTLDTMLDTLIRMGA